MTETKQFIEDMVKGGFPKIEGYQTEVTLEGRFVWIKTNVIYPYTYNDLLLKQKAWQAVGEVRGWEPYSPHDVTAGEPEYMGEWVQMWHDFIDHLAEGKTIEEALKAIR